MPNKSLSRSSLTTFEKYSSMLAGNTAFDPSSDFLLEEIVLSSSAASVTFSGLGAYTDYKHLQIRYVARTDRSSALDTLRIRVNSDGGNNYKSHELVADGSSVSSTNTTPSGHILSLLTTGNTSSSGIFGAGVVDILDYGNTNKSSTFRSLSGENASFQIIELKSGLWLNTSAITSLYIYPGTGPNWLTGSRFSLYGSKG